MSVVQNRRQNHIMYIHTPKITYVPHPAKQAHTSDTQLYSYTIIYCYHVLHIYHQIEVSLHLWAGNLLI